MENDSSAMFSTVSTPATETQPIPKCSWIILRLMAQAISVMQAMKRMTQ